MQIFFDSKLNQKLADKIDTAVRYFLSELIPEDKQNEVLIDIDFNQGQDELGILVPDEDLGDDEFDEPSPFPYSFYLTLKYKRKDLIQTLAHECVHIKQFVMGELDKCYVLRGDENDLSLKTESYWHGEKWEPREGQHESFDSPWEVEAYGREVGLAHSYHRKFRK